jgi:eukaryotic-like serine/threonine-protein kinase
MPRCPHCDQMHPDGMDYCPRTGRPVIDVSTRMVGRTIAGKYRLVRCIGQGGMGTIFEAEHTLIGNHVAVKLLHDSFASTREPVQRLYREARAMGTIGHQNIIKVYDVGENEEGTPFLVMELLQGESLGEHLEREGPQRLGFVLDVGVQMLSALHAAHTAGIIHRDLKCDNIFLEKDKDSDTDKIRVKLLDFGVSKFTTPEEDAFKLTQTGSVLGTPYYMSPEQASGQKNLDHRLDIYAAGVILYEMLIGNVPRQASNYNALLTEIITTEVASFAWRRPDISPALEAVILKAVSRSRSKRWQRAVDLMEALVEIRDSMSSGDLTTTANVQADERPSSSRDSNTMDFTASSINGEETPFSVESDSEIPIHDVETGSKRRAIAWTAVIGSLILGISVLYLGIRNDNTDSKSGTASVPMTDQLVEPQKTLKSDSISKDSSSHDSLKKANPETIAADAGDETVESTSHEAKTVMVKKSAKKKKQREKRQLVSAMNDRPAASKKKNPKKSGKHSMDRPMDNPF